VLGGQSIGEQGQYQRQLDDLAEPPGVRRHFEYLGERRADAASHREHRYRQHRAAQPAGQRTRDEQDDADEQDGIGEFEHGSSGLRWRAGRPDRPSEAATRIVARDTVVGQSADGGARVPGTKGRGATGSGRRSAGERTAR
jgi:hypothetical protein